jgi:hypothetical protein
MKNEEREREREDTQTVYLNCRWLPVVSMTVMSARQISLPFYLCVTIQNRVYMW